MARARSAEWVRLAQAAGLANGRDHRAVEAGRRVEGLARAGTPPSRPPAPPTDPTETIENKEIAMKHRAGDTPKTQTVTDETRRRPGRGTSTESFVDRIKAALAA